MVVVNGRCLTEVGWQGQRGVGGLFVHYGRGYEGKEVSGGKCGGQGLSLGSVSQKKRKEGEDVDQRMGKGGRERREEEEYCLRWKAGT